MKKLIKESNLWVMFQVRYLVDKDRYWCLWKKWKF